VKFDRAVVRAWVAGVLRGVYAPAPDEEVWEWAERTLRIPGAENEEMAGMFYSTAITPYVREVLRWARQPGKGEFWIKKSSQVGFTMALLVLICWMIVHRPGNVGYAIDSVDEARKISKIRLKRWILDNRLLDEVGGKEEDLSNLTYVLRGMTVYLMGSFSKGAWANKSIVLFILDELDKHTYIEGEGTTVTLARERCKRPKNAKIVGFSTPGDTDQITKEWKRGTQEEVRIPFPCCNHKQALKWGNLVFGTKEFKDLAGGYDLEKVRREAYFKCELCGGRLLDGDKRKALLEYEAVATNPKAAPGIRSLHIWDAYSPFVSFGELACEWIEAQGDMTLVERFMRGRRGEQYERSGRELKADDILAMRGGHKRGTCPVVPVFLGQTIDIQGDVQKTVKFGVDEKGNIYVIDWKATLVLSEAMEWAYEPVVGPDGENLLVEAGFCDEGHRAHDVRRGCLDHCPVWWPVKGRGGIQVKQTVGTSEQWIDGEWILTYHVDDDGFKWDLLGMIRDNEKRKKTGAPRLIFPEDVDMDEDFVDELTNEVPERQKNKLGREIWKWKVKGPNDFWDCVKYALALWRVMAPMKRGGDKAA
jgi:phage terminase large subunit GpA-like protein